MPPRAPAKRPAKPAPKSRAGPTRLRLGELGPRAEAAAKRSGMPLSAFIRDAVRRQLGEESAAQALGSFEEKVAATVGRLHREVREVRDVVHLLFAQQDSFVRLFLMCVPEAPTEEALKAAEVSARRRYKKFVDTVARNFNERGAAALAVLKEQGHGEAG